MLVRKEATRSPPPAPGPLVDHITSWNPLHVDGSQKGPLSDTKTPTFSDPNNSSAASQALPQSVSSVQRTEK